MTPCSSVSRISIALSKTVVAPLLAAMTALSCGGQTGDPGLPTAVPSGVYDATTMEASPPALPPVSFAGEVRGTGSDAGIDNAIVVVEVGGVDRPIPDATAPDGAPMPTLSVDPFIQLASVTNSQGAFSFTAPVGALGLHVFSPSYVEALQTVKTSSADAHVAPTLVSLEPLSTADGAPAARPLASDLSPSSPYVAPGSPLTFAVEVSAGSPEDPLSRDIFLVETTTGTAVQLAPPTPGIPGGPYPDGVYSLIVTSPQTVGAYTYTVVAASLARVTSLPVSVSVAVTYSGGPPFVDASAPLDAFFEGGGLPDGRI